MTLIFLFFININAFIFSKDYISFDSTQLFFEVELRIGQTNWGVFIDTINDYFILYDPPNEYNWPKEIINESKRITKENDKAILNYDQTINATIYTSSIRVDNDRIKIQNFSFYYTKHKARDDLVWNYIYDNYRQLSCGLGLNVQNPEFSLVYSLFNRKHILKKTFSFFSNKKLIIGQYPEDNVQFLYNTTYNIPLNEKNWGFSINSISLGKKRYSINQYALINSAIEPIFRSYHIYSIFKDYLLGDKEFKNKCSENIINRTIYCSFNSLTENTISHNVIVTLDNGIQFNISLSDFFKIDSSTSSMLSLSYVYYDNAYQSNLNDILQVGIKFIKLFDKIEFNYDNRNITFSTNTTGFFLKEKAYSFYIKKKLIIYVIIILLFIFSCFLGVKLINKRNYFVD